MPTSKYVTQEQLMEATDGIKKQLDIIQNNHLAHLAADVKDIKKCQEADAKDHIVIRADIKWIMRVGGAMGVAVLAAVISLLFRG